MEYVNIVGVRFMDEEKENILKEPLIFRSKIETEITEEIWEELKNKETLKLPCKDGNGNVIGFSIINFKDNKIITHLFEGIDLK